MNWPNQAVFSLVESLRQRDDLIADLRVEIEQLETLNDALFAELHKKAGANPKTSRGIATASVALISSIVIGPGHIGDLPQGVAAGVELYDRFAGTGTAGAAQPSDPLAKAAEAIDRCQRIAKAAAGE